MKGDASQDAMRKRHSLKTKTLEVADVLQGSYLLSQKLVVRDLIKFSGPGPIAKRLAGYRLPRNTLSSLYENLLLDRLDFLGAFESQLQLQLNEVMPLLFSSLKLVLAADPTTTLETMHLITQIDDFLSEDPQQKLLGSKHLPHIYKPVEMIARLYVSDSLKYAREAEYWLEYAHRLAQQMLRNCPDAAAQHTLKLQTNLKRC